MNPSDDYSAEWFLLKLAGACLVIACTIAFWWRFYRMMDDVRRLADKLAPREPDER